MTEQRGGRRRSAEFETERRRRGGAAAAAAPARQPCPLGPCCTPCTGGQWRAPSQEQVAPGHDKLLHGRLLLAQRGLVRRRLRRRRRRRCFIAGVHLRALAAGAGCRGDARSRWVARWGCGQAGGSPVELQQALAGTSKIRRSSRRCRLGAARRKENSSSFCCRSRPPSCAVERDLHAADIVHAAAAVACSRPLLAPTHRSRLQPASMPRLAPKRPAAAGAGVPSAAVPSCASACAVEAMPALTSPATAAGSSMQSPSDAAGWRAVRTPLVRRSTPCTGVSRRRGRRVPASPPQPPCIQRCSSAPLLSVDVPSDRCTGAWFLVIAAAPPNSVRRLPTAPIRHAHRFSLHAAQLRAYPSEPALLTGRLCAGGAAIHQPPSCDHKRQPARAALQRTHRPQQQQ